MSENRHILILINQSIKGVMTNLSHSENGGNLIYITGFIKIVMLYTYTLYAYVVDKSILIDTNP